MIYSIIFIIVLFLSVIFFMLKKFKKSKLDFETKIQLLESLIKELSQNIEYQNQKVRLSDDLKEKFKTSNYKLSEYIFDLNLDLFEALCSKK